MGPHRQQCPHQIGRADAAVGAKGCQAGYGFPIDIHQLWRRYTHHRAPVGIEGHGRNNGQPRFSCSRARSLEFLFGGHGFQPDDIGAAVGQRPRLLSKGALGCLNRERPNRLQNLPGRSHRPCNDDIAIRCICARTGYCRGRGIQFPNTVFCLVKVQPVS